MQAQREKAISGHRRKQLTTNRGESSYQKPNPANMLILDSQSSEQWENKFLLLKAPSMWYFVMAALADEYTTQSMVHRPAASWSPWQKCRTPGPHTQHWNQKVHFHKISLSALRSLALEHRPALKKMEDTCYRFLRWMGEGIWDRCVVR